MVIPPGHSAVIHCPKKNGELLKKWVADSSTNPTKVLKKDKMKMVLNSLFEPYNLNWNSVVAVLPRDAKSYQDASLVLRLVVQGLLFWFLPDDIICDARRW